MDSYMLSYWAYVLYTQGGGGGLPCPRLSAVVTPSCALSGHLGTTSCLLVLFFILMFQIMPSEPNIAKGLGQFGGVTWSKDLTTRLPEDVKPVSVAGYPFQISLRVHNH